VWDNIPTNNVETFKAFVENEDDVHLYIGESDMVYLASSSRGDDDDYGNDLWAMSRDHSSPSWYAVDSDNTFERRREEGLISNRRDKDEWLAGVNTDTPELAAEYLAALQGHHGSGRIDDPRQQAIKFESMRRHIDTVRALFG
jgi:hypothetical protein